MGAEHFSNLEEFVGRCDIVAINVRCPFSTRKVFMRAKLRHCPHWLVLLPMPGL